MRGQGSVEYIVLLTFTITFFLIVIFIASDQLSLIGKQQRQESARIALKQIADAATDVYQQGSGAKKVIQVTFPQGTDTGSGIIINNTLHISFEGSDISYLLDFPISGSIPSDPGSFELALISQGGSVSVGITILSVGPQRLDLSICSSSSLHSENSTLTVINSANYSLAVSASSSWTNGSVNISLSPISLSILPLGTGDLTVTVNVAPNVIGLFSGSIEVNSSNFSSIVPVTVTVSNCAPSGNVSYILVDIYDDSGYSSTRYSFTLPKTVNVNTTGWIPSSYITLDLKDPANISVFGYPKLVQTNSSGGYSEQWPTGSEYGTYTFIANWSSFFTNTTFSVLPC